MGSKASRDGDGVMAARGIDDSIMVAKRDDDGIMAAKCAVVCIMAETKR